ncbi:hypothetical protein AAFF_G00296370 [Aldrovandia affinis]|uniref:Uncharacterized protein n=1 Tax=Aldrovandia affinis TaxID=143900 RepID=A0AAD7WRH3_9TELE|nr:hypothetical protein AAFF_G00296370 [Aldrovandia affinis]
MFGGGNQYAYFRKEDETSVQLVDTAKMQKTARQSNRVRFAQCCVWTVFKAPVKRSPVLLRLCSRRYLRGLIKTKVPRLGSDPSVL